MERNTQVSGDVRIRRVSRMFYIYRITNTVNNKTYVGQRHYEKDFTNDKYMGSGILIKAAIKKYGKDKFKKEIIYSRILNKKTADSVERYAIKKERSLGHSEYNISDGGTGGSLGPVWNKGRKCPQISEANKGKKAWNKGLIGEGNSFYGKKHTESYKRYMSELRKGITCSEETKAKMSAAKKGCHWKIVDGKRKWCKEGK